MATGPVLITGCSSGIGYATAERLLADGHTVYATARRPDSIAALAAKGATTLALDVTDDASMSAAVARVTDAEGAVGVLINNAGYSQSGAVESVPVDDVRRQFETNVFGLIRMCQLVLPGMRERGAGTIVNIGSMGGRLTFPGGGIYHASKYAVEAISDALRFEVRGFGVDVVLIEPGLIVTNFGEVAAGSVDAAAPADADADADAASKGDGPYGDFNRHVATTTAGVYQGPMAKLGGPPEVVAGTIAKALKARRPKARYAVTPSAHLLIGQRRLMPDRVWDLMMRAQFPTPKR
jgi:NADP-dependent 3-hydroxy acid dehydrogenase YdfG